MSRGMGIREKQMSGLCETVVRASCTMMSKYEWMASLGITFMIAACLTGVSHDGTHYFWPHYLGFAFGVAFLLCGVVFSSLDKK